MTTVIDSSAVLAILKNEPGAEQAVMWSRGAFLSAVNLIEVRSKLMDIVEDVERAIGALNRLEIHVAPFTAAQAKIASDLWPLVKGKHILLADRACLALAMDRQAALVTADHDWAELSLPIDFRYIR